MAVTKIWPVRGRLDSLIRYAENEEKTRMPDLTGLAPAKDDLTKVLQYAANHSKTTQDRQLFVSGVNCLPEKIPNHRPPHPAMREDLRHWEQIEAQLHLLERYSLQTREEVEQFITQKTEELQTLEARRTHCRNRLRRCRDQAECANLYTEKDRLTEKICAVRKELRTAQKIPPRADRMRERIELLNAQEQQHAAYREER